MEEKKPLITNTSWLSEWRKLIIPVFILLLEWTLRKICSVFQYLFSGSMAQISSLLSHIAQAGSESLLNLTRGYRRPALKGKQLKSTEDIIVSQGYPFESHHACTPDGFIIGLHRVPRAGRRVVLLWHGLLMSSEAWVCQPWSKKPLPFVLHDAGYDVWLGNTRGNKYSSQNLHYKRNTNNYWNYSLDEIAVHDLPCAVNYVLGKTGKQNLSYVAFSQGAAQGFAALSLNKELNKKVNIFIALAPAAKPKGLSAGLVTLMMRISPATLFVLLGRKAFLPSTEFWAKLLPRPMFKGLVKGFMYYLFKWKCDNIGNRDELYQHLYSTSSVKQAVHWLQIIHHKQFRMYIEDEGFLPKSDGKSLQFPTHSIVTPIALFYGKSDSLLDIDWLLERIPKPVFQMGIREYEHLCLIWGKGVEIFVYPKILELIDQYGGSDPEALPVARSGKSPDKVVVSLNDTSEFELLTKTGK